MSGVNIREILHYLLLMYMHGIRVPVYRHIKTYIQTYTDYIQALYMA